MKILVLGGDGMLGHQVLLSLQFKHNIKVTLRQDEKHYTHYGIFNNDNSFFRVEITDEKILEKIFSEFQPEAVINAVGIVKQRDSAKEYIPSLEINALFPHRLANLCKKFQSRLIHFSTDCIFSGETGFYKETDPADAIDLYGRSKYLGELSDRHCVTIRSSIIGLELTRKTALIEWFLSQSGIIKGYRQAIYSGLTTLEMSRVIEDILLHHAYLSGVWHIASQPINKYELLSLFSDLLGRDDIRLIPIDDFLCNRSLNGEAFNKMTGYHPPSWEHMLTELAIQAKERYKKKENLCSV